MSKILYFLKLESVKYKYLEKQMQILLRENLPELYSFLGENMV